jgi:hypothetical protein
MNGNYSPHFRDSAGGPLQDKRIYFCVFLRGRMNLTFAQIPPGDY